MKILDKLKEAKTVDKLAVFLQTAKKAGLNLVVESPFINDSHTKALVIKSSGSSYDRGFPIGYIDTKKSEKENYLEVGLTPYLLDTPADERVLQKLRSRYPELSYKTRVARLPSTPPRSVFMADIVISLDVGLTAASYGNAVRKLQDIINNVVSLCHLSGACIEPDINIVSWLGVLANRLKEASEEAGCHFSTTESDFTARVDTASSLQIGFARFYAETCVLPIKSVLYAISINRLVFWFAFNNKSHAESFAGFVKQPGFEVSLLGDTEVKVSVKKYTNKLINTFFKQAVFEYLNGGI